MLNHPPRCVAENGPKWKYEACFFDKAFQSETHAQTQGNKVNLGSWRGFRGNYHLAIFEGGDACEGVSSCSSH